MAKGEKGGEEKEDYEFVPPDFDEDAFIHKEMVSFKTTSTLIIMGIAVAVLSWLLFAPVGGADAGWYLGLLLVAASFAVLKPLYKALHFDISHYGRREWLGTGFLLFFTWLAFFMILLNPPFSDHAPPTVALSAAPSVGEAGQDVRIDLLVADNTRALAPTFRITGPSGQVASEEDLQDLGHGHYRLTRQLEAGTYTVSASTQDPAGHESGSNMTLRVVQDVVRVTVGDLTDPTQEILAVVPPELDVWAVYADLDHDPSTGDDRVYLSYREDRGGWEATGSYSGWHAGTNNFTIFVEERNRFENQLLVAGAVLSDGPHTVTIDQPGDFPGGVPRRANPTDPPVRSVPGVEVPLLAAGLVGVALVARRRR